MTDGFGWNIHIFSNRDINDFANCEGVEIVKIKHVDYCFAEYTNNTKYIHNDLFSYNKQ